MNESKRLTRPITVEASTPQLLEGVSIKEVKEILTSSDLARSLSLYELMLQRDLHLSAAINTRKEAIAPMGYTIDAPDAVAKYLYAYIERHFDLSSFIEALYSALEYGFCVVDLVYGVKRIEGKEMLVPIHFRRIDAHHFDFDNARAQRGDRAALYIRSKNKKRNYLERFDERKLLLHLHREGAQTHICRYSPLHRAAWFVALKHQAIAANMQYFDALGIPPLIIHYDGRDEKEIEAVLYQALSLRSNSVGVFPENTAVKLLTEGASKADFLEFIHYIDKEVSFFLTSQVLATDAQKSGSYAQAKVHENRLHAKRDSDAKRIAQSITTLLEHVVSLNFSQEAGVRFAFVPPQEQDTKTQSEVIKNLTSAGYLIPAEHIEKVFGIKGVSPKQNSANTPQSNATDSMLDSYTPPPRMPNAASSQKPLDKIEAGASAASRDQRLYNALVTRFYKALNEAQSFEEAYTMLLEQRDIDEAMLERVLAEAIAKAHLAGLNDGTL